MLNPISRYEAKVITILQKAGIAFEKEKRFSDLHYGYYRFDFYLPLYNCCIEVNGEQHYRFTKHFYRYQQDFWKAQWRDRQKISYCLAHGMDIYCIPFWDMDKISHIGELLNPIYIAHSKFHNDEAWRRHKKS